jgi:hypothetical protein
MNTPVNEQKRSMWDNHCMTCFGSGTTQRQAEVAA